MRGKDCLYAPSAPFGEAIDHWLDYQQRQIGVPIRDARDERRRPNSTLAYRGNDIAGLEQLGELAGITVRQLNRYRTGSVEFIELDSADRLALALDIPLPLLAESFKPASQTIVESRRNRRIREMTA